MKQLEIVFTKSKKKFPIFSWLIRLWTGKPYSHVAKGNIVKNWGKAYYQASEGKVNYEYVTFFKKKHIVVKRYILRIPGVLNTKIKEKCYKEAGNNYALMQNIGIALVDILKILGIKIKNPWKKGRNCSELLYLYVLKQMHPELNLDPDTIKPHHIERILEDCCKDITIQKEEY
jgi:hypothetical protein